MVTGSTRPVSACLRSLMKVSVWADDSPDGAVEPLGRVDGVGQQVAGHAGAGHLGVQPPQRHAALRHLGRDGIVLVVHGAVVEGPPHAAFVDDLPGQRHGGHAAIVERHHVGHARLLDRGHHLLPLGGADRQRLLADDHFAGGGRGQDDVVVQHVGHANVDQLDVRPRDELAPIEFHRLVAPDPGEFFQLVFFLDSGAAGLQHRLVLAREEVADLQIGVGMGAAHEAAADHADIQRFGHGSRWLRGINKVVSTDAKN